MKLLSMLLLVSLLSLSSFAQDTTKQLPPQPCSTPEFRQFDFWLGEWALDSRMRTSFEKDEWQESTCTNSIELVLDSCVIMEHFDGNPAANYKGKSLSTYNQKAEKWQQTWVDNYGGYLDFVGEFKEGKMIFLRETETNGVSKIQRMVFHDITDSSLTWNWETSKDNGATWVLLWELKYTRIN